MKGIPFRDNKGNIKRLKASATIEDLVKAGIDLKVMRREDPLPDGWFRSVIDGTKKAP